MGRLHLGRHRLGARAAMSFRRNIASRNAVNRILELGSVLAMLGLVADAARAQDRVDFKGKTVTIVASFEAGGPYDFYSRLIARHIGSHLPGSPNVVVQNMPGAGGLRGAHFFLHVGA